MNMFFLFGGIQIIIFLFKTMKKSLFGKIYQTPNVSLLQTPNIFEILHLNVWEPLLGLLDQKIHL